MPLDTYKERAYLVAYLASQYPCSLEPSMDCLDDPDFNWTIYIDLPTGQVSWHLADTDLDLFSFVQREEGREWDGHDTVEKYKRLRDLTLHEVVS